MGRPSEYTLERGEAICERLAMGETLTSICKGGTQPGLATVYRWQEAHSDFREALARARKYQGSTMGDLSVDVLMDATSETIQCARELSSRYAWRAKVGHPNLYGDRVELEHTGDAAKPMQLAVATLTPERQAQLREIAREAMLGSPTVGKPE